ncbi:MAG: hypothetical protein CMG36_06195 [Candidatus Marinimicrobia bacterium]|jgi:hypothetical protein|nr:hypothetical protein [Candidatus Neomarinimicrobiota bacterium]MEC8705838.1 hypothetical protein [Candidatus Neomarinimicrobiota bacterium]GIS48067.1 MAG: hypothetical protein Ct9H90mP20_7370 [Candidatus Neomarinimicrobiota bacterium]|tara:strand:+ start:1629 stop:2003 length:375 start_codon:yes stop_codon:yes gene_type:complete
MVRFHEYYQPKDKILSQCREILLSLDYEIDMFSTESYSLTTKSMRVRKTLRRYDYVLFVQITDKVEVHISAKRSIFRRGSESNIGKYDIILEQTEDRLPIEIQRKIFKPIQNEFQKNFNRINKI